LGPIAFIGLKVYRQSECVQAKCRRLTLQFSEEKAAGKVSKQGGKTNWAIANLGDFWHPCSSMFIAPIDSPARLEALQRYDILDTPPEDEFDDIVHLIARICDAPIALINFVDRDRQWFKSELGLGFRQTSLDISFCSQAILQTDLFIVPDALMDPRFVDNPLVKNWPHLRFYAGSPLETSDGFRLGTLCVCDFRPRGLLDTQKEALRTLSRQVMVVLELRRMVKLMGESRNATPPPPKTVPSGNVVLTSNVGAAADAAPPSNVVPPSNVGADADAVLANNAAPADNAVPAVNDKNEFLSKISHELRTPLAPVLMTSYALLLDDTLSKSQRADIEMIRTNIELEAKMIDELLDHTRVAGEKLPLRRESVDVHRVLDRVEKLARGAGASLPIETVFRAANARVIGDAGRLEQAFWNVLRNSVKFTPPTGAIAIITSNPQPDRLRVRIIDSGLGIDPEELPRLFSGYESEQSEHGRHLNGVRLGLPIAKGIFDRHEGTIQAKSSGKNKGATFTIELPVTPAEVAPKPAAPAKTGTSSRALRILVVEDHESTATILTRLLRSAGHDVTTTLSASAAKALFERREFDLVIADLGLPDENGLDLFRYMKDRKATEGIALSGYGMQSNIDASLAAGFREHLVKPVDWPRLESVVNAVAARLQSSENGSSPDKPLTSQTL
jgi:signal transduction histidine kinase/ActR/RegA family two-component response regulator